MVMVICHAPKGSYSRATGVAGGGVVSRVVAEALGGGGLGLGLGAGVGLGATRPSAGIWSTPSMSAPAPAS